jgi:hypothetical protein
LLPHLRLDDLLAELQVRLSAAVKTRDRVHALLEAVVAVGTNLELKLSSGRSSKRRSLWSMPGTARWGSSERVAGWLSSYRWA